MSGLERVTQEVALVYKKDLTPIGGRRGKVDKHDGKGSSAQRTAPRMRESLTGGSPVDRMTNRYPKPASESAVAEPTLPLGPPFGS